jgi:dipeptidyl-peptidase III
MKILSILLSATLFVSACNNGTTTSKTSATKEEGGYTKNFEVAAEEFGDLQAMRYEVPGFNELTAKQKELCYYLYEAALCGRDMIYDQKGKYGIYMRKILENMYGTYTGDKNSAEWKQLQEYCGRFWFSSGNHHHYGNEKFIPACPWAYFESVYKASDASKMPTLELKENEMAFIKKTFYDLTFQPKCVDLRSGIDNVVASSNNFYEGVTLAEVEAFYAKKSTEGNAPSWGLNSKTMKENGVVVEKIWKSGGMYGAAIDKICGWLDKAITVAENDKQKKALTLLAKYYRSGDLKDFDDYSVAWVQDVDSRVDVVNGFIEVYLDAIGKKGSFESTVSIRDEETTKKIKTIAENAQWFEDNSPLDPKHKKKEVKGITAKAITAVVESGDAAPSTPIGINLPNADWIRKEHGSKSVSLSNIVHSYNVQSAKKGTLDEFGLNDTVKNRIKEYGALASDLHTDMHECIGHASGQINPGVETTDKTLKNYASCLEEARADLVGLYFIMDKKLIDIGVMPNMDVAKAEYDSYMMNGLMTQLTRLKLGDNIEEAHMRNRQLNALWAFEKGKAENVVSFEKHDGKTYIRVNDYEKLRVLFGQLLKEIQRIKSEGDFKAGQALVENYGVKVDKTLHKEILERYSKLGLKPYRGFIQPKLIPVMSGDKISDVKVEYPTSFFAQMMEYGKAYGYLGVKN